MKRLNLLSWAALMLAVAVAPSTASAHEDGTITISSTFNMDWLVGTVSIKGDRKREANETFSVQLSNAVGAIISGGVATVTILNDD
jgi:hypothetical protein